MKLISYLNKFSDRLLAYLLWRTLTQIEKVLI